MKQLLPALLVALLFLPGAHAQTLQDSLFGENNEGETIRYQIRDLTNSSTGGFTDDFQFLKLHTNELAPAGSILRVNVQATFGIILSSDGQWLYQLLIDGVAVQDCFFVVPTVNPGGFLSGDFPVFPSYDVDCTVEPEIVQSWEEGETVGIQWTRSVLTGVPDAPTASTVNLVVEREDFIVTNSPSNFELLTGLSALEFAIFPTLAFLGVILWSRAQDGAVRVFGAVLTILSGVLLLAFAVFIGIADAWFGTVAFASLMMLVGVYLIIRFMLEFIDLKGAFR